MIENPFAIVILAVIISAVGVISCFLSRKELGNIKILFLLSSMLLVLSGFTYWNIGVELPISARYQREFGAHVNMAYTQATFESIKTEVRMIWTKMNSTFDKKTWDITFNTPLYWEQNYESSLTAQNNYLSALDDRIDSYIEQYNILKTSTSASMLEDWYDTSINNLRSEMRRYGGLDWVIQRAWAQEKYPFAFTINFFQIDIIFLIVAAIVWWVALLLSYQMGERQLDEAKYSGTRMKTY